MPKTLKDAVEYSVKLQYDFLWIDCLCILQSNDEDWQIEGEKMDAIYEGSVLTISASSSTHCADGFLEERTPLVTEGVTLELQDAGLGPVPCKLHVDVAGETFQAVARRGPVAARAWCLQERRLAPRVLHFCRGQVVFECVRCRRHESEAAANDDFIADTWSDYHMPRNDHMFDARAKPAVDIRNILHWFEIVEDYTYRDLFEPDDKLMAIAGLAKKAQGTFRCDYLAGLWSKDIHIGLAWTVLRNSQSTRNATYRAPSWSWASMKGPIAWEYADGYVQSEDGFLESAITLKHASTTLVNQHNPLGQVKDGVLVLVGRLLTLSTERLQQNSFLEYPDWMRQAYGGNQSKIGYYMHDETEEVHGEVSCLKIANRPFGPGPSIPPTNIMLVLERQYETTYKRIGYGQILVSDFFDEAPLQTVRLV